MTFIIHDHPMERRGPGVSGELPERRYCILQPLTHGDTYEAAARQGHKVPESLIATAHAEGEPLAALRERVG